MAETGVCRRCEAGGSACERCPSRDPELLVAMGEVYNLRHQSGALCAVSSGEPGCCRESKLRQSGEFLRKAEKAIAQLGYRVGAVTEETSAR
jgi:hypothetical protein